ncbi:MSH2 protein, partial [Bonamia ostreae]
MASFSEAAASPFPSSKFSNSHIYVKPEILPPSQNRMIRMRQGRHPLLDCSLDREVIANDVEMNQNSILQIITGPNMGGKSTYLKQVAAIQLMAQIGSFVPCEEIEINLVKSIFARVGAADSQSKGISTFMSE